VRADGLAAGEHFYRARATDQAGHVGVAPPWSFEVTNAAPAGTLAFDAGRGTAPHTFRTTITGTDADNDRLSYTLDFGDGQTVNGTLPAGAIAHRYDRAGVYWVRLDLTDGRETVGVVRAVTVTGAQLEEPPPTPLPSTPLSLSLSAASVDLGTFVPGLARDYAGTLTATTSGPPAALRVSDPSATARGRLVGPAGALSQPLQVRAVSGAFAPLTAAVAIPSTIEFKQSIGEGEVLRPGTYAKALTFTLSVTTP
jgi:hypothetical protein